MRDAMRLCDDEEVFGGLHQVVPVVGKFAPFPGGREQYDVDHVAHMKYRVKNGINVRKKRRGFATSHTLKSLG